MTADETTERSEALRAKVMAIFAEFAGERAERLSPTLSGASAHYAMLMALNPEHGLQCANEIASYLADWGCDAAFLVAIQLFPERFSAQEVRDGVELFFNKVPDRVVAAATLYGCPMADTFGVGAKIDAPV